MEWLILVCCFSLSKFMQIIRSKIYMRAWNHSRLFDSLVLELRTSRVGERIHSMIQASSWVHHCDCKLKLFMKSFALYITYYC